MVNVSSSYYVGTLVTETLHMCICRIKSLKAICFQIYLTAKNLKPSPLNYKSKTEKKENKCLRDLSLQRRETSKISLFGVCFLHDFHVPGKAEMLTNIPEN